MKQYNIQNNYKLCGTTRKGNPRYLQVIDFMFQNQDKAFSRSEMLLKSGYAVQNQIGLSINSSGSFCYLTSALNRNKIISYDKSIRKWKVGENFITWCHEYYPEVFTKFSKKSEVNKVNNFEVYTCDFLTKKYSDNQYITDIELDEELVNQSKEDKKLLIENELKTIEQSIQKIRDYLKF